MRVSTFSVSLSASWSGAVTQAASAATSAALSQAGPSGGGAVHAAVILSVALVAAFVSFVPVEASLTGSQVPDGQSGLVRHGAPGLVEPLEHCGRQTVATGSFPFERLFSHAAIAFWRDFAWLRIAFPSAFVHEAVSARAT